MNDPFVCARCAAKGPTCCELTPGCEDLCFPISKYERERILECAPDLGGFVLQPNTAIFIENLLRLFPDQRRTVRELFPLGGTHYRLALDEFGKCLFLGPEGCRIPQEARPYYCRLFPFWTSENGQISILEVAGCLAQQENKTAGKLLKSLDVSLVKARKIHEKLRIAWGFDSPPE